MLSPLTHPVFRSLLSAQIVSLLGTGLMTVALALLAFELAGDHAGAVLGTAFAIKMIAYVTMAPVANAITVKLPSKAVLVGLDLFRAAIAIALPFVDQVWQIYLLVFVLQSASAAFTPVFQATIPSILDDEADYTKALSLSRLAYDLESLISPLLAGLLLTIIGFSWLFAGTAAGFVVSAAFIAGVRLPQAVGDEASPFVRRITGGVQVFLAKPRLRGLMFLNLAVAAVGAMVIVNTVVVVRTVLDLGDREVAFLFAAYGAGSMAAALVLPRLLGRVTDRSIMLAGGAGCALALLLIAAAIVTGMSFGVLSVVWLVSGAAYSATATPAGRLLARSTDDARRSSVFAAQFTLSHACWLITYPLAGWGGTLFGMSVVAVVLSLLAALGTVLAARSWPLR